jgi:hypothetical protein
LRKESITDMAEAMFGYVKSEQMPYGKSRAYAGRVFFSDALALPGQDKLMSDRYHHAANPEQPKAQHVSTLFGAAR